MTGFSPIVSSNLDSAAFSPLGFIIVRFKNGTAGQYSPCDVNLWKDFKKTFDGKDGRSAGKFLHQNLKPLKWERIDDWK
jgi:hypothetical protein